METEEKGKKEENGKNRKRHRSGDPPSRILVVALAWGPGIHSKDIDLTRNLVKQLVTEKGFRGGTKFSGQDFYGHPDFSGLRANLGDENWTPSLFFLNFSGAPGLSWQNPGVSRQKVSFPWLSKDIPNFLAPTPSCERPPSGSSKPHPSKPHSCNMSQAKTEVALQFSKCCAAEVALQHWLFCCADVILTKKLRCSKPKAAVQHWKSCVAEKWRFPATLSCDFQAPTFRHPRLGPAEHLSLAANRSIFSTFWGEVLARSRRKPGEKEKPLPVWRIEIFPWNCRSLSLV